MNSAQVRRWLLASALLPLAASAVHAQVTAQQRAADLAVNGALGAARGFTAALITHRNPWRAAAVGFSGGAIVGVAKQWTGGATADATGLAARALAGIGESVTMAAAADSFRVYLPLTPVLVELSPTSTHDRVRVRFDVAQVLRLGYALTRPGFRFDARASLRAGAPVVRTDDPFVYAGSSVEARTGRGVVLLAAGDVQGPAADERRLAHESIHVIQQDQADLFVGLAIEDAIVGRWIPGGDRIVRWIEPGIVGGAASRLVQAFYSYRTSPWEREAFRFGTAGGLSSGIRMSY